MSSVQAGPKIPHKFAAPNLDRNERKGKALANRTPRQRSNAGVCRLAAATVVMVVPRMIMADDADLIRGTVRIRKALFTRFGSFGSPCNTKNREQTEPHCILP
jgi:hypothetical protein